MAASDTTALQARTFRLDELLEHVRDGRIRVPRFQRTYRWTPADVLALFDSVYRGFPIGTLLFWEREAGVQEVTLGNGAVHFVAEARPDALFVVDGQQRINALALSVLHELFDGPVDRHFEVAFDLRRSTFVRPTGRRDSADAIPVAVAFNLQKVLPWLRDHDVEPALQDRAFELTRRLRDYEVPAYLVRNEDESVLREIFDRMNTFGQSMRRAEVFHALHSAVEGTSEPSDLRQLAERLSAKGFGDIGDDLVLLVTLATRGGDVLRDFRDELGDEDPADTFRRAEAAFDRAVAFLRDDARIPHVRLLPYAFLLVGLVAFFARHPDPSPRNRVRLRRWLWRAAVHGTETLGGYTPTLRRTASVASVGDADEAVEALLALVPTEAPARSLEPKELRLRITANRIAVAALLALEPVDLDSGALLDADTVFAAGSPSVARLFDRAEAGEHYLLLANVVFVHPDAPAVEGYQRRVAGLGPEALTSHAMDDEFVALVAKGSAAEAIEHRHQRVVALANGTAAALAEWGSNDRRAITDLVTDDDHRP